MIPVYASERATIAGWFAYRQPTGRHVLWTADRMIDLNDSSVIELPASFTNNLPNMFVAGWLDGTELVVDAIPSKEWVREYCKQVVASVPVIHLAGLDSVAEFHEELMIARSMLSQQVVEVLPLPESNEKALTKLRQLGPDWVARHPESTWLPVRTAFMVSAAVPPFQGVAEILYADLETYKYRAQDLTPGAGRGRWVNLDMLYLADAVDPFKPGTVIKTFLTNGTIVGYSE